MAGGAQGTAWGWGPVASHVRPWSVPAVRAGPPLSRVQVAESLRAGPWPQQGPDMTSGQTPFCSDGSRAVSISTCLCPSWRLSVPRSVPPTVVWEEPGGAGPPYLSARQPRCLFIVNAWEVAPASPAGRPGRRGTPGLGSSPPPSGGSHANLRFSSLSETRLPALPTGRVPREHESPAGEGSWVRE